RASRRAHRGRRDHRRSARGTPAFGRYHRARPPVRGNRRLAMAARAAGYPDRLVATPWIALLGFLALAQTAHLLEHIAQMVQIHVLHLSGAAAQGIVGQLDIEWVHFSWNALVLITL